MHPSTDFALEFRRSDCLYLLLPTVENGLSHGSLQRNLGAGNLLWTESDTEMRKVVVADRNEALEQQPKSGCQGKNNFLLLRHRLSCYSENRVGYSHRAVTYSHMVAFRVLGFRVQQARFQR
jgi:hypothetical protein